jgi:hypothetical protein
MKRCEEIQAFTSNEPNPARETHRLVHSCTQHDRIAINRLRDVSVGRTRVGGVTIGTTYVVAPVFAAPEVIAFLFAGVTGKAGLGNLF